MPQIAAARLLRYAHFIGAFDYKIEHRSASLHKHVDYLSRTPLKLKESLYNFKTDDFKVSEMIIATITQHENITADIIRKHINNDNTLATIKHKLLNGELQDPEISLHEGVLFEEIV